MQLWCYIPRAITCQISQELLLEAPLLPLHMSVEARVVLAGTIPGSPGTNRRDCKARSLVRNSEASQRVKETSVLARLGDTLLL